MSNYVDNVPRFRSEKILRRGVVVFSFMLTVGISGLFNLAQAQKLGGKSVIKGIVVDSISSDPLPGAHVTLDSRTKGTATNTKGQFTIQNISSGRKQLVVSFIGYKKEKYELNIGKQDTIRLDVMLKPVSYKKNEVVVTALGIKRKNQELGYSVQDVTGSRLKRTPSVNVASSLTGKVSGLTVYNKTGLFESPDFELRGKEPLIVVNGVPYEEANLYEVSSDDIKSITVLKGTTASALYGSRGKDGAIMIETKKGSSATGGITVSYDNSTMMQLGYIAIPETQNEYGTGNAGKYSFCDGKYGSCGVNDASGWIWGPRLDVKSDATKSGWVERKQYNSPRNPKTGELEPIPWISRGENNLENFLRTGLITSNNVSVAGSDDDGHFRISLSHKYQKGQVPNTKLNMTNFSISGSQQFGDHLTAEASWTYSKQYTPNYPYRGYGPQNYIYNTVLWMGPDVDVRDLKDYWQEGKVGIQQRNYNYVWYNNPYFLANEHIRNYYKDVNYGHLNVKYEFNDHWNARIRTGVNFSDLRREEEIPKSYLHYGAPTEDGNFEINEDRKFNIDVNALVQYRNQLTESIELKSKFGVSNNYRRYNSVWTKTDGLNVPELYNVSNSSGNTRSTNRLEEKRVSSLYGTVDLGWRNALFLGLTGRNDWSSALPIQNNSYFYPSVSLSAVISNFVTLPDVINYFKVRSSWARVSSDLSVYSTTPVYNSSLDWNGTPSVSFPGTQLNPNIKPQQSTTWEIGTEISMLDDRLGMDVTYYNTLDENDIMEFPVSRSSGFDARLINANKYRRKGIEVSLNTTPLRNQEFQWDINANWSRHRRYLESLPDEIEQLNGVREGERMDLIRTTVFARSPEGEIIYENGFPIEAQTEQRIGHDGPDWVAGIEQQIRYQNFVFNVQFDGRYGGLMHSTTIKKMWWGGTHPGTVNEYRAAEVNGEKAYVGDGVVVTGGSVERNSEGEIIEDNRSFKQNETEVFYSDWLSSYYHSGVAAPNYHSETFVKLREVSLTYRLPESARKFIKAKKASISIIGKNLWMWSEIDYLDPDSGNDDLQTPSTRQIGFNLNLSF